MFVHCCHCRWCQRNSGSAFAVNAMIESDRVQLLHGDVEIIDTPTLSGKGEKIARCPHCRIAVWSNYADAGTAVHFLRAGTLDDPQAVPPDAHIYIESMQPWVALTLPEGARSFAQYYKASEVWPADSLARRAAIMSEKK